MARKKHRKPKAARHRTIARKRSQQLQDEQERTKRKRHYRRRQLILAAKRRKKAIESYRALKRTGMKERQAAQQALERREIATISHTSVKRIFHQYYLPTKARHPKGKSDGLKRRRYRRPVANELWHLDFKGPIALLKGCKVWLLVVIDDFSRFCLGVHSCESACTDAVITALGADCAEYGKPKEILTDKATAFTPVWLSSVGQLTDYLASVGVEHKLISPYYPESNGKAEAFIKILSTECLKMKEFADCQEIEALVAHFVTYYNPYRAHGGVGYKPPVWWYTGTSPKVQGLGGLWGLETVAQQWSGESSAAAPIVVTQEKLTRYKALVPIP